MTATMNAPIILDMGKTRRKRVKQLRQGRGKLLADVQDALAEVTATLGEEAAGRELVPVVLIYRRKQKRKKGGRGLFPVLF